MADIRVAVLGAAGFAGALCASLVQRHPRLELTMVTARSDAGRRLDHIYPRHRVRMELENYDPDVVASAPTPRSSPTRTARRRRSSRTC